MAEQPFRDMVVLFSAGMGLLLFAAAAWFGRGWGRPARLRAAVGVAAACALGPVAFGIPEFAAVPAAAVGGLLVILGAASSARLGGWFQGGLRLLRRPAVQAGALAVMAAAVAAGSVVRFEIQDAVIIDRDMEAMAAVHYKPPMRLAGEATTTDAGDSLTPMQAEELRDGPAMAA